MDLDRNLACIYTSAIHLQLSTNIQAIRCHEVVLQIRFLHRLRTVEKYFGVVVTELIKRKLGKVCHIYIMTGRQRHKWQYLVKDIEQFAKDEGCQMMELIARPGWQKVLNNYGYQRTHVVLEKKIKQEEKK